MHPVVAARHSDGPAVTAASDETAFLRAVRVGDVVHVDARITWTARGRGAGRARTRSTSMKASRPSPSGQEDPEGDP
ncbi:hotdog domain-containing protein [Micromonospora sp. MP36]|uniref:hotdog domain-containing protein n=1 Tax=unclassified Micromonospora TaxID=2617518 RepID=UPI00351BDD56